MQFVTSEGGLTAAGYALFIVIGVIALLAASYIAGRRSKKEKKGMPVRQLAFCAMALALSFVTSYIKVIRMPYGGSVTLFSMLFITLVGYWYGLETGLLTGLVYGIMQFLQEPYYLSLIQVCLDYLFAFAALGLSGIFRGKKGGLIKGYVVGVLGRLVFSALAGYAFWMSYMPENFPKSLAAVYPIAYNGMYLGVEAVVTVIVLAIPAVKNAIDRVTRIARSEA